VCLLYSILLPDLRSPKATNTTPHALRADRSRASRILDNAKPRKRQARHTETIGRARNQVTVVSFLPRPKVRGLLLSRLEDGTPARDAGVLCSRPLHPERSSETHRVDCEHLELSVFKAIRGGPEARACTLRTIVGRSCGNASGHLLSATMPKRAWVVIRGYPPGVYRTW
jgi:hypothetical protein